MGSQAFLISCNSHQQLLAFVEYFIQVSSTTVRVSAAIRRQTVYFWLWFSNFPRTEQTSISLGAWNGQQTVVNNITTYWPQCVITAIWEWGLEQILWPQPPVLLKVEKYPATWVVWRESRSICMDDQCHFYIAAKWPKYFCKDVSIMGYSQSIGR